MEFGSTGFSRTPRQELRSLLDSVVVAGRTDVHDYCGGHLNEANLRKLPQQASHKSWSSAKKPTVKLNARSSSVVPSSDASHQEKMKETLVNFSLGTLGNVFLPPVKCKSTHRGNKRSVKLKKKTAPVHEEPGSGASSPDQHTPRNSPTESQSSYDKCNDGVLVEELNLPEVMLSQRDRCSGFSDGLIQHKFLTSHLDAVTKKDQFNKLKRFETEIIRKQDASERRVMQGTKAVEHLEAKLQMGLAGLDYDGNGPNFYRLQVYSSIFEELSEVSPTFGFMLKTIKREYDAYVASLLDGPTGQHQVLSEQVAQLASHQSTNPSLLALEQTRVADLEEEAREMLEENERLRQAVQEEMERPPEPEPEPVRKPQTKWENNTTKDLVERIEGLKGSILDKLDAVKSLRAMLRTEYVPSTVCTHLEQCIKETEVEIQRLMSNKNYFESNVNEMEKDLQEAIENADTTERDQRRVWKRISNVKSGGTSGDVDSETEQDDASKWDWYIS